jgi:flagellar biogenesis protein FliO
MLAETIELGSGLVGLLLIILVVLGIIYIVRRM